MGFLPLLGALHLLLQLVDFIWFYFLRPSDGYKKYQKGPQSYAVVTDATDGIGKSMAKALYRKGFNVIAHGRNKEKLKTTAEEIKALREDGTVEFFVADVDTSVDYAEIANRFDDLNITLLVNNVGGANLRARRFEEWSEDDHFSAIRWNVLFPTLLTRAFLPSLRKTSLSHPVLVAFNGLSSAEFAIPRVTGESNVEFMCLHTGSVQSNATIEPAYFSRLTYDDYAAYVVKAFGSGREDVIPYVGHKIGFVIVRILPNFILRFIPETKRTKKE